MPSDVGLGFVLLQHLQAQRKMLAQRDALQQTNGGYGSRSGSCNDLAAAAVAREESGPTISPRNRTTLLFRRSGNAPPTRIPSEQDEEGNAVNQHAESQTNEEAYGSFSRKVLSPTNPDDYALLEEGARFARHQLAIYTVCR